LILLPREQSLFRCPDTNLGPTVHTQSVQDVFDMVCGSSFGDDQFVRDLTIREPLGHKNGDLQLPRRQRRCFVVKP